MAELDALLPATKVRELIGGKSDMTLHRYIASGTLPKPIYLNRRRYWRASTVAQWLDARDDAAEQADHRIDREEAAERAAYARSQRANAAA